MKINFFGRCSLFSFAHKVTITLKGTAEGVLLRIADDGQGFVPGQTRKGLGLTNIKNRVELFNGQVDIKTAPQQGCTLQITVPLTAGN